MKRTFVLAALILLTALGASAQTQNSNSVTFTVVTPPPCSISALAPTQAYVGAATTLTLTGVGFASTSTASYDAASIPMTFVSATSITIAVPAAKVTLGAHTIFVTCPLPVLSMNSPVALPNGKAGVTYSANLAALSGLSGGVQPYSFSLTSPLPAGLTLSSSGSVSGVPSSPGSFSFGFTVSDASLLTRLIRLTKFNPA